MTVERAIIEHYRHGALENTILKALAAVGKDLNNLTPDDLAPVDEFHVGGRQATIDFVAEFHLKPDMHWLDIGSGIGGTSRYIADRYKCRVTGIDLHEEYIEVARSLSQRVGLDNMISYRQVNALALPFESGSFDGASMLHVGMNIADKPKLFAETHRVLKPGGIFAIYDLMGRTDGAFYFPLPWASSEETNFVETITKYRTMLSAEGFHVIKERDSTDFATGLLRTRHSKIVQASGPPALGLQILMGAMARQKVSNMVSLIERNIVAPMILICRRV